jgi:hypothetical protein
MSAIDERLKKGHERPCDTYEGGSCDCGFERWLYGCAEKLDELQDQLRRTAEPIEQLSRIAHIAVGEELGGHSLTYFTACGLTNYVDRAEQRLDRARTIAHGTTS